MNGLVLREHNEEIEKRRHELYDKKKSVGEKAANKYLPQFKEYVKSLKFKTSMQDAIGGHSSIRDFRERARHDEGLDKTIEQGLRENPARALSKIGVEDAEIAAELAGIAEGEAALKEFIKGIPKHPIPNIDRQF